MCCSMTQEAEDWEQISEQVEQETQQPTADETVALSASVQTSTSTDGTLAARLPQALGAAADRISLQVRRR